MNDDIIKFAAKETYEYIKERCFIEQNVFIKGDVIVTDTLDSAEYEAHRFMDEETPQMRVSFCNRTNHDATIWIKEGYAQYKNDRIKVPQPQDFKVPANSTQTILVKVEPDYSNKVFLNREIFIAYEIITNKISVKQEYKASFKITESKSNEVTIPASCSFIVQGDIGYNADNNTTESRIETFIQNAFKAADGFIIIDNIDVTKDDNRNKYRAVIKAQSNEDIKRLDLLASLYTYKDKDTKFIPGNIKIIIDTI